MQLTRCVIRLPEFLFSRHQRPTAGVLASMRIG